MTYKVVWQSETFPVQSVRHLGETLSLDEVVEGEGREHGAVSVYLCLDKQSGTTYTIELDLGLGVRRRIVHLSHEAAVGSHLGITFQQNIIFAHLRSKILCCGTVDPVVEIVFPNIHSLLFFVVVSLEAVGDNDGHVVVGEILDQGRRGLDDVGIHPQNPRGCGAQGCEQERVARLGHSRPSCLLILHLVTLGLALRLEWGLGVLTEDSDGGEAVLLGSCLCLGDLCLQRSVCGIALLCLWYYEAQRDEVVWVAELEEVVPVLLVELCQRCEDEDRLFVLDWRARVGHIVHVVMHDGRRGLWSVCFGLAER